MVGIGAPSNEVQDAAPDSATSLAIKLEHDGEQLLSSQKKIEDHGKEFLKNGHIDLAGLREARSLLVNDARTLADDTALAAAGHKNCERLQDLAAKQKSLSDKVARIYGLLSDTGPSKSADKRDSEAPS